MAATVSTAARVGRAGPQGMRVAFVGPRTWLQTSAPRSTAAGMQVLRVALTDASGTFDGGALQSFAPSVTVVFSPERLEAEALRGLPGLTLGVLTTAVDRRLDAAVGPAAEALDRVVSFRPALSGTPLGDARVWRTVPPPVADEWFAEPRPLHGRPLVMTLGRSTEHREGMLMAAKHHHDILQVLHGVGGEALAELLAEHPVAVYVPSSADGGFGAQVPLHLAAGQLLFASGLQPLFGLEPGLDFIAFQGPDELVQRLDRLARFPEMGERVRVRGRMKAEGHRASRLFARILADLAGDVATFGSGRR